MSLITATLTDDYDFRLEKNSDFDIMVKVALHGYTGNTEHEAIHGRAPDTFRFTPKGSLK